MGGGATSREQAWFSGFAITNGESEAQQGTAMGQFSTGGCTWQCHPAPEPAPLMPGPEFMVWGWGQTTVVPAVPRRLSSPQHRASLELGHHLHGLNRIYEGSTARGKRLPTTHVYAHPNRRAAIVTGCEGTTRVGFLWIAPVVY